MSVMKVAVFPLNVEGSFGIGGFVISARANQIVEVILQDLLDREHRASTTSWTLAAMTLVRLLSTSAHPMSPCTPPPHPRCGLVQL